MRWNLPDDGIDRAELTNRSKQRPFHCFPSAAEEMSGPPFGGICRWGSPCWDTADAEFKRLARQYVFGDEWALNVFNHLTSLVTAHWVDRYPVT